MVTLLTSYFNQDPDLSRGGSYQDKHRMGGAASVDYSSGSPALARVKGFYGWLAGVLN